ncbi:PfkB family carbohydrate kinase [Paramicrobacterium agarici]|uniref:PfkB family carbohydrate kinase n=1 Tax=Paramicrobacterium agarici TaxID=630514 RepID=UPI001152BB26|nr:PfkB family carbohydrate kinase [Microbacterium agarici]TQO22973.1 fructoselysine 6-kinase [Microbacterium agarici]
MTELSLSAVGDNTVDIYYGAEDESFIGGNALNTAVQWSLMGTSAAYYGAVGPDDLGYRVRAALTRNKVKIDGLTELPGKTSTTLIRVEPSGDRIIAQDNFEVSADYMPSAQALDEIARSAFVHIGMSPFASRIRSELAHRGARISQDCAVSEGYDYLDVAFCSAGEGSAEARAMAREAVDGGARLVVVTCGADGSIAFDGREWTSIPAVKIPSVVDTTGAGDSYIAGFVAARAGGKSVLDCMKAGASIAATTCQHRGGFPQNL